MGGGVGIGGGITDAVGLTSYKYSKKQSKAAKKQAQYATDKAVEMQEKSLKFQKQQHAENMAFQKEQFAYQQAQYEEWKSVYGDLQQNLGDYYKTLDSSKFATRGIQAASQEYNRASKEIQKTLAQRGISDSGVAAASETALRVQEATGRATARATAEDQVRAQQAGFLGIGLGQGTQMLGQQAALSGTISGAYGQGMANIGSSYGAMSSAALQGGLASANIQAAYGMQQLKGSQQMSQGIVSGGMGVAAGHASVGGFL